MRKSENESDMFWNAFDRHFDTSHDTLKPSGFLPNRQLIRTAEWVEPELDIIRSNTIRDHAADLAAALDRLHLEMATQSPIGHSRLVTSEKLKTRGI